MVLSRAEGGGEADQGICGILERREGGEVRVAQGHCPASGAEARIYSRIFVAAPEALRQPKAHHSKRTNPESADTERAARYLDHPLPWQLEAIDRIQPLLQGLADNTEATIAHFNDNRHNIHFPAYHQYARTNADLANQLATLVTDYVDFGEHEAESQRLQQKLAMTAS